ncbi:MAG: integrase [Gammaproteobacteria bacterium (ex Lamellibrachia satsuma)]|nr:MAG: site-specific integrase [Gammaproteobacteria bacterium (ex Lamellibrachia satsuma)]RRS32045.1 MAG: integrase [Gammaproteobacteria bacterium (ex Lamellibrachia satsuma)]
MADIRKRVGKKGTTYQVRYPSNSNKSCYSFATFNTLKEARAFTENLGALQGKVSTEITSVSAAVQLWLDICEKIGRDGREKVEPETLKEYHHRGRIMQEYDWPKSLQELGSADIVHFRNWLLQNKTRDQARRTLSSLHSVLIEMKHQGHILNDPAAGISIKSGGRYEADDGEVEIPSDQEMRDIFAAADVMGNKNDFMEKCWARYRPMIYLAGFTGMRPSEYRGLPWNSLFEDRVEVRQRADKTGIIGPVKSRAGRRTIFLPKLVTEMIFDWHQRCPSSKLGLVFPTETGKPLNLGNFRAGAWLPLLKEADLMKSTMVNGQEVSRPKYTPYVLRHYFASKLIEKGKDLKFIQDTMGHSKIEVTLNVYGHFLKGREEEKKLIAEELAADMLNISCGKFVANSLQAAE